MAQNALTKGSCKTLEVCWTKATLRLVDVLKPPTIQFWTYFSPVLESTGLGPYIIALSDNRLLIKSNRRILMMLHKLYGETELPEFMITKTPFKMTYHNGILQDKATVRILDFTLTKLETNNFIIKKPFVNNGDSNIR